MISWIPHELLPVLGALLFVLGLGTLIVTAVSVLRGQRVVEHWDGVDITIDDLVPAVQPPVIEEVFARGELGELAQGLDALEARLGSMRRGVQTLMHGRRSPVRAVPPRVDMVAAGMLGERESLRQVLRRT